MTLIDGRNRVFQVCKWDGKNSGWEGKGSIPMGKGRVWDWKLIPSGWIPFTTLWCSIAVDIIYLLLPAEKGYIHKHRLCRSWDTPISGLPYRISIVRSIKLIVLVGLLLIASFANLPISLPFFIFFFFEFLSSFGPIIYWAFWLATVLPNESVIIRLSWQEPARPSQISIISILRRRPV